jgi:hypothetical protein
LIFAAGLLACFQCHLDPACEPARRALRSPDGSAAELIDYIERQFSAPPLEILAQAVRQAGNAETARLLFDSYDAFLALLDNREKRAALGDLEPSRARSHPVFMEVREMSHQFQSGLTRLFFKDTPALCELTEFYGVF